MYDQGWCHMKSSDKGEEQDDNGRMAGNRNCGLLSQNQWDQILGKTTTTTTTTTTTSTTTITTTTTTATKHIILSSDERNRLAEYLTTPLACPKDQNDPEQIDQSDTKGKATLPILDVFLNPNRSKELEHILALTEKRAAGSLDQKVIFK